MHSFIRFIAIALPWLFFLVGMEVMLDAGSSGGPVFVPNRLLFVLLPAYAGIVVIVFRITGKKKDGAARDEQARLTEPSSGADPS
jgi:hypothetical protein